MWPFRKRRPIPQWTGVGAVLSAAHRDQITGQIHGHDWEVIAWFPYTPGRNAVATQYTLERVLKRLDHGVLPDQIAWGEALAEHIRRAINSEHSWCDGSMDNCCAVDVIRHGVKIYARSGSL